MAATILVVEDNELNRMLVRDLLDHAGYVVVEAGNTDEARRSLARTRPDLVLMDIQVPGGGGELLLSEIRADAALAPTPVVAVTALAMAGDEDRLLARGFDDYLSKPIDTRRFLQRVERLLQREAC